MPLLDDQRSTPTSRSIIRKWQNDTGQTTACFGSLPLPDSSPPTNTHKRPTAYLINPNRSLAKLLLHLEGGQGEGF